MENENVHLPLITLTSDKGPNSPDPNDWVTKVENRLDEVGDSVMKRFREREAREAEAKKDPMYNLRVALLRGDPNRTRLGWSQTGKKKRW
jgi:hypothetical protein